MLQPEAMEIAMTFRFPCEMIKSTVDTENHTNSGTSTSNYENEEKREKGDAATKAATMT